MGIEIRLSSLDSTREPSIVHYNRGECHVGRIRRNKIDVVVAEHKKWMEDDGTGQRADLSRRDLTGAKLCDRYLRDADLHNADLERVDLQCCDLRGANLSDVSLVSANLHKTRLLNADLSHADLRNTNLSNVKMRTRNSGAIIFAAASSHPNTSTKP